MIRLKFLLLLSDSGVSGGGIRWVDLGKVLRKVKKF